MEAHIHKVHIQLIYIIQGISGMVQKLKQNLVNPIDNSDFLVHHGSQIFVQKFVHANNTENIKAPHLGPLWGESTHVWVQ